MSRIDDVLSSAVASGALHGVVAMAADDSGIIYQGAHGLREAGAAVPMSMDTTFRLHSMTKAVAGVAAMQLVEQGKLALDAPLAPLLPRLANKQVLEAMTADGQPVLRPARGDITLRHLLTHTAGFGYDTWNPLLKAYFKATGAPAPFSGKHGLLDAPLTFDPGTRWQYSIAIDWVGQAVEAASGLDLNAYFQQHIFAPLGMDDTTFVQTGEQRARRVSMHRRDENGVLVPFVLDRPEITEFFGGGGGLFGTIPDYLAFTRALLAGGAPLLRPETMTLMAENHIGDLDVEPMVSVMPALSHVADFYPGMKNKWGLTFLINTQETQQGRAAGSLAWAGLSNLYFWIDPKKRVTGVFATQILPFFDPQAIHAFREFERAVYLSR
jgi:CubicO group peptidase (beta-lactamase class C family)